jgi:hypothetical protein
MELLFTLESTAELLGKTTQTIRNMVKRGELKAVYPKQGKNGRPSMMIVPSSLGEVLLMRYEKPKCARVPKIVETDVTQYTVISTYHLKDTRLSLKAKGLLSLMFSLSDDWNFSIAGLVAICKESETAVNSALHELISYGYLSIKKKMPHETPSGRIEYDYIISEIPQ